MKTGSRVVWVFDFLHVERKKDESAKVVWCRIHHGRRRSGDADGRLLVRAGRRRRNALADSVRQFLLAETMRPLDSTIGYDNSLAFLDTPHKIQPFHPAPISGSLICGWSQDHRRALFRAAVSDPNGGFYFRLYRYNLWDDPVWSPVTDFTYSGFAFNAGKVMLEANVDPGMAMIETAEFSYGLFLVLPVATSGDLGLLRCVVDTSYAVSLATIARNSPGQ